MQSSSSPCPCGDFKGVEAIRKALDSEARTQILVEWLSNKNDGDTNSRVSYCKNHDNGRRLCENRLGTSVTILNAIRDACRHYVVTQSSDSVSFTNSAQVSALKISTPTKKPPKAETYEDAFPSLGGSSFPELSIPATVLVGRKKVKQKEEVKTKSKRRIRPAPAPVSSSSPWNTSHSQKGNISRLPSESPLTVPSSQKSVEVPKTIGIQSNSKKNVRRITPTIVTSQSSCITNSPWTSTVPLNTIASQHEASSIKKSHDTIQPAKSNQILAPAAQASAEIPKTIGKQLTSKKNIRGLKPETVTANSTTNINSSFAAASPPRKESLRNLVQPIQTPDRISTSMKPTPVLDLETQASAGSLQANLVMAQKHSPTIPSESTENQLRNLIGVYSTILKNHLAPSTALELHLLIRLLTVPKGSSNWNEDTMTPFSSLFCTGSRCQIFAVGVLKSIQNILKGLGFSIVSSLVECLPFRDLLPEVTSELRTIVDSQRDASLLADVDKQSSIGGNNKTPMLTLPFDQKRDSRHNFRSREESNIYKNREESRDAFLYQLRAFQNFRGRVVDTMQAERALQKIQNASKEVVRGLFTANMPWFAQVFVELLLQIGLVPMEETDKELLNITNKDRLQKLHRRFSSKEVKTSKSSQKLVFESKNQIGASSTTSQPQQHFSGHQEYFFLFIQSADSYNFGMQLKLRLSGMLSKLASIYDTKGLEKRLLDMQLLAKFLGVLVFSPNWEGENQGVAGSADLALASPLDDLSELDTAQPALPLVKYINDAWKKRRLVAVVPWIVEFLRMLQWDNYSQRSKYYLGIFELLRSIHLKCCQEDEAVSDIISSNMQLVSFYLESLFSDVVGLGQISTFQVMNLQLQDEWFFEDTEIVQLDATPLLFSKPLLFASSPYLEELFALISALKDTAKKPLIGVSPRKMRPYSIKSEVGSIPDLSLNEADRKNSSASKVDGPSRPSDGISQSQDDEKLIIQRKLVDAFFHQHKDLKEICGFVVDRALKKAAIVLPNRCIIPCLEKGWEAIAMPEENISDLKLAKARISLEEDVVREARSFLKTELDQTISEAMPPLCPSPLSKNVLQIAISLAIAHGIKLGESVIEGLVRVESKKKRDAHARIEKRQLFALSSAKLHEVEPTSENEAPKLTTDALNNLADSLIEQKWEFEGISKYVELAENAKESIVHLISPTRKSLRKHTVYNFTSKLDPCGPCFVFALDSCLAGRLRTGENPWSFAYALLDLCITLAETGISHRVLKNLAVFLSRSGKVEDLILLDCGDDLEVLGELLVGLIVKAEIVSLARLEEALIYSHDQMKGGSALVEICLRKLHSNKNGLGDAHCLPRLRHKLNI